MLFRGIQNDPLFIAAFKAVKPASVALILVPVFSIAKRTGVVGFKFLIPVMIALLITFTPLSPVYVILASIAGGILYYGCKKEWYSYSCFIRFLQSVCSALAADMLCCLWFKTKLSAAMIGLQIHSLRILLPFLRLHRGRLRLIRQRTSDIQQQTVSGEPSAQRPAFLCRLWLLWLCFIFFCENLKNPFLLKMRFRDLKSALSGWFWGPLWFWWRRKILLIIKAGFYVSVLLSPVTGLMFRQLHWFQDRRLSECWYTENVSRETFLFVSKGKCSFF